MAGKGAVEVSASPKNKNVKKVKTNKILFMAFGISGLEVVTIASRAGTRWTTTIVMRRKRRGGARVCMCVCAFCVVLSCRGFARWFVGVV